MWIEIDETYFFASRSIFDPKLLVR